MTTADIGTMSAEELLKVSRKVLDDIRPLVTKFAPLQPEEAQHALLAMGVAQCYSCLAAAESARTQADALVRIADTMQSDSDAYHSSWDRRQ